MAYDETKPVESLARKGEGPMKQDDFERVVKFALDESVTFGDTELSPDRALATKYYKGDPLGNEEEGRSQVVLTEVRDTVDGMLPDLVNVFTGNEHAVEFEPTRQDNVAQAEQMTDYVRYVFERDNPGFLHTLAVLKDGMVRKLGIFKWGWDESSATKAYKLQGITKDILESLAGQDDVELTSVTPVQDLYDVELTKSEKDGRARVWSVPPEEFFYNRSARSVDEALLVGHRTEKTRGELLAMGVKEKDIKEYGGAGEGDTALRSNAEEIARRPDQSNTKDPEMGKANDKIAYCEAYMTVDFDGDGIAELRRICTIGPDYYPVTNDPCDERPFSVFTPYPEPHALIGGSVADRTMDMQRINSALMRGILDSASISAFPRTVYLEGQASVADIMNTAIGAPIRERVAGAVRNLEQPFTGKELLPVLMFGQEVIERRTGRDKGSAGLDADALQSTGKEAVGAVLSGGAAQTEMMARVFAEMTFKPLFKGLAKLLNKKQPKARLVRLRGQWVEVAPGGWDLDMDVMVNVGLGRSFTEKKIATLVSVAADQKEIASVLGLSNPLVGLGRIRATRAKILELQGIKDVDSYYAPIPLDYQPPPAPPVQDAEQQWIELEKQMNHEKTIKELSIKQDELALNRDKLEYESQHKDADRAAEADKVTRELAFRMEELVITTALERAKIEATINAQAAESDMNNERTESEASTQKAFGDIQAVLTALAAKENAPPVIHLAAPDFSTMQPPVVNVHPPVTNVSPPNVTVEHHAPPASPTKKRKAKITKNPDGSGFTMESD